MTNKHTPGPWTLELIEKWPFGVLVSGSNGDIILQQNATAQSSDQKSRKDCENGVGFNGVGDFSRIAAMRAIATQDANARLIAAAPELLSALIAMEELIVGAGINGASQPVAAARDAIEKATGER